VDFQRMNLWTGADKPWSRVPYEMIDSPLAILRLVGDRTWFAVRALYELNQLSFDILHVHLPFTANVLVTLAPWLRDKMIYTAHVGEEDIRFNLEYDDNTPAPLRYFSPDIYLMNRVAYNTVLNPDLYSKLQEKTNISNIKVIPNGVDLEEFPATEQEVEEVKDRYDLSNVSVLFAGSITPRKGVDTLIEAANIANRKLGSNLNIILVGNTDIDAGFVLDLKEEIEENDIENIIEFTGFIPWNDLKGLYSACDIFTLPSREEGFGMVVTEALASGKPVIGTNVGGIQSQVIDGDNGFLIEP
ncbi:MAG: glycosyltransferase family 4 protein, partial [Halobacteriaceae archaeon]